MFLFLSFEKPIIKQTKIVHNQHNKLNPSHRVEYTQKMPHNSKRTQKTHNREKIKKKHKHKKPNPNKKKPSDDNLICAAGQRCAHKISQKYRKNTNNVNINELKQMTMTTSMALLLPLPLPH